MASSPYIEQLRLTRFKSFRDAVLPLRDLTLLIGRNASGKSNAIDGLHVLSRLADGEDLREAIDGNRREGQEVRGGVRGCAPYGESSFELGCTVARGADRIELDIVVRVEPDVQIASERLHCRPGGGQRRRYLITDHPQPGLTDIVGRYFNGSRGLIPRCRFVPIVCLRLRCPRRSPRRRRRHVRFTMSRSRSSTLSVRCSSSTRSRR
ncbi:MAG: AAA family ATPase [Solirubrobacteraceae bacterium]